MGNALEFTCPSCGDYAQKPVSKTEVTPMRLTIKYQDEATVRRRERYCGKCKSTFSTLEMSESYAISLQRQASLADHLLDRFQPPALEQDWGLRTAASAYLRLLWEVFDLNLPDGVEGRYPLTLGECALIIHQCEAALRNLPPEDEQALRQKFMLSEKIEIEQNPKDDQFHVDVSSHIIERALRKLRHPSRVKRIRMLLNRLP